MVAALPSIFLVCDRVWGIWDTACVAAANQYRCPPGISEPLAVPRTAISDPVGEVLISVPSQKFVE